LELGDSDTEKDYSTRRFFRYRGLTLNFLANFNPGFTYSISDEYPDAATIIPRKRAAPLSETIAEEWRACFGEPRRQRAA
jgi:hypothetical protein